MCTKWLTEIIYGISGARSVWKESFGQKKTKQATSKISKLDREPGDLTERSTKNYLHPNADSSVSGRVDGEIERRSHTGA